MGKSFKTNAVGPGPDPGAADAGVIIDSSIVPPAAASTRRGRDSFHSATRLASRVSQSATVVGEHPISQMIFTAGSAGLCTVGVIYMQSLVPLSDLKVIVGNGGLETRYTHEATVFGSFHWLVAFVMLLFTGPGLLFMLIYFTIHGLAGGPSTLTVAAACGGFLVLYVIGFSIQFWVYSTAV
jgi:hypothetical protein